MLPFYVSLPCNNGYFDELTFEYSTSLGSTGVIALPVSSNSCQNLQVGLNETSLSTDVCTPVSSTLVVKNVGVIRDTYSISSQSEYVSLSHDSLTLSPGSSAEIRSYVEFPCDKHGSFTIPYTVSTEKSQREARVEQQLTIRPIYNVSLSLDSPQSVCQESDDRQVTLTLTNENSFDDTYTLSFDLPSFISDNRSFLERLFIRPAYSLSPNQSAQYVFTLEDLDRVDQGSYPVSVDVHSERGDVTSSLNTSITVSDCHDLELVSSTVPQSQYSCVGDTPSHSFTINNTGSMASSVELVLNGPDMLSLSEGIVDLDAGETQTVTLASELTNNSRANTYPVSVDAYVPGSSYELFSYDLVLDSLWTCYGTSVKPSELDIVFDQSSSSVELTNKGTRHATYALSIVNGSDIFSLNETTVSLAPSSSASIDILSSANNAIGSSYAGVLQVYNTEYGITHDYPFTITVVDHSVWYKLSSWFIALGICLQLSLILLVALAILLVITIIKGSSSKIRFSPNYLVLLIGLGIFLIGVVYTLVTVGAPSSSMIYPDYNLSEPSHDHITMLEDTTLVLDHDSYFFDPDDNIKTYGVDSVNKSVLDVSVANKSISLTPVGDWFGNTSFSLFVIDEYNESVSSGSITLEVLDVPDYSFCQVYGVYCGYANLVYFLSFVLVVFVLFSLRSKSKPWTKPKRTSRAPTKRSSRKVSTKKQTSKQKKTSSASKKTSSKSSSKRSSKPSPKKSSPKKEEPEDASSSSTADNESSSSDDTSSRDSKTPSSPQ